MSDETEGELIRARIYISPSIHPRIYEELMKHPKKDRGRRLLSIAESSLTALALLGDKGLRMPSLSQAGTDTSEGQATHKQTRETRRDPVVLKPAPPVPMSKEGKDRLRKSFGSGD